MRFFKIDRHYQLPEKGVDGWMTVGFYEPESGVEICVLGDEPSQILVSVVECGYGKIVLENQKGVIQKGVMAVPITCDTISLEAVVEEYTRDQRARKAESAGLSLPAESALLERTINAASRVSLSSLQLTLALGYLSANYAYQMLRSKGDAQIIID